MIGCLLLVHLPQKKQSNKKGQRKGMGLTKVLPTEGTGFLKNVV